MTAIGVAVVVGVCGMLTPEGETKKYVRFAGALCLICALTAPIIRAVSQGDTALENIFTTLDPEVENYDEIYKNSLAEGAKSNAEAILSERLIKQFNLSADSFDVSLYLTYDGASYSVESAQVTLKSSAVFADPREISEFINGELDCPCYVVYD